MLPVQDAEGRYRYPVETPPQARTSTWEKFRAWNQGEEIRIPPSPLPADSVLLSSAFPVGDSSNLHVTWIGHSSLLVQLDGFRILFDPVLTNEVSPVPWIRSVRRFQTKAPVTAAQLPQLDAVFLSHDHYDHLDKEAVLELAGKVGIFLAPLGVGQRLRSWGIDSAKVRELTWWQEDSLRTPEGRVLRFACTPARHFSGRTLTDRNSTLFASWAVQGPVHAVFHSGDSGYGPHFRQIGFHYGPFDLVMMECGQYNSRWKYSHMVPEESVQAHLDVKGRTMIPIHWGSFNLSTHNWWEPPTRASIAAATQGVRLLTPRVGKSLLINSFTTTDSWWVSLVPQDSVPMELD